MTPEEERCAEARRFERIDDACHRGDMAALRAALDDPPDFLNCPMPLSVGPCLEYAVYHNDYTALHQAVVEDNLEALTLILDAGADPRNRTRIDDVETPRELAEAMRKAAFSDVLAEAERRWAQRDGRPA